MRQKRDLGGLVVTGPMGLRGCVFRLVVPVEGCGRGHVEGCCREMARKSGVEGWCKRG